MGFNEFLSSIFGNKATRDMKEIKPWVDKVKAAYPEIAALDNDALRAKTEELKAYIRNSAAEQRAKVEELKASVENTELEEREELFAQIDKIEKEILDTYEKALDEVLPVAFSIVKETAKRFSENEEIVVTATEFDSPLPKTLYASKATKPFIRTTGWPAATTRYGTWCTTMCSCLAVWYCTKAKLPKWQPVKVRHWLPPCRYSSTH